MPIIASMPVDIADREALAFELAEVINDALISEDRVSPLDVAHRVLRAIDHSVVYCEGSKPPALPQRRKTMLDMDAVLETDRHDTSYVG